MATIPSYPAIPAIANEDLFLVVDMSTPQTEVRNATGADVLTYVTGGILLPQASVVSLEADIANIATAISLKAQNDSPALTGNVSSTGTLGYATGAGGTVTQATSKSTGVTLNKITGAVTMHNASLANATAVTFTVTNSTVGANDAVTVNHASAGTAGAYLVSVSAVAAGSFKVTVYNVSGGALGEAIVIKYSVLKGVAS